MKHSIADPFKWYKKMSQEKPVFYEEDFQLYFGPKGAWQVFRYEDVQTVLNDYETFSAEYLPKEENPLSAALAYLDPPRHGQLRLLVSKAFTPKAIENMKPWIAEITNQLLDDIEAKGEFNVVDDLAAPLPIQVIAKMLGVPYEDRAKFKEWSTTIIKQPSDLDGGEIAYLQAQRGMVRYFMQMFELRKDNKTNDLISDLLQVEVEGKTLPIEDVLAFCILLLVAGNETTTNLITSAVYSLIEHPSFQEQIYENPELIPNMIEEVLRYRAPVQFTTRIAAKDVELKGQKIKKGDIVIAWIGSANHDENIFANADRFDIHRTNLKHISFGHGVHYCIGSPLARLEANIVFRVLFNRLKDLKLKFAGTPEMNHSVIMYSIKELPVTFQKRA